MALIQMSLILVLGQRGPRKCYVRGLGRGTENMPGPVGLELRTGTLSLPPHSNDQSKSHG